MIATGIAAGIAANVLYDVGKKPVGELRDIVAGEAFSSPMSEFQEKFEVSLKEALNKELSGVSEIADTDIEENWDEIIREINSTSVIFDSKEGAIEEITDSIITGLGISDEENHTIRGKIEIAVARAYRRATATFLQCIEEEGLSTEFQNQSSLRINEVITEVKENLRRVETRIIQRNDSEIRDEGFVRFDPLYFRRKEPSTPETAWRQGFDHVEIESGYAINRERSLKNKDERINVTREVVELLKTGGEVAVLGEPGSGKSTICKQVACEWHGNHPGSVFYRRSNSVVPFRNPGTLIEAINVVDDDVLVVVEDAVDKDAAILFELVNEFRGNSEVSFLFDARLSQWNKSDDAFGGAGLANLRSQVDTISVPSLDVHECERIIKHFETLTGRDVDRSADSIFESMENEDYGDVLLLSYILTGPASGVSSDGLSAFEYDVYQAFSTVDEANNMEEVPKILRHKVGILVNLLNAARLPVSKGFIHSIAKEPEDHWKIETVLDFLEGTVVTENQGEMEYRTFHERWSTLYLSRVYDKLDLRAISIFEECVENIVYLPEDTDKIESIQDWLAKECSILTNIQIAPQRFAEHFTTQITRIATRRPELAHLFIDCGISFSNTDSPRAEVRWANNVGLAAVYNSRYGAAEDELKRGIQSLSSSEETDQILRRKSVLLDNMGTAKRKQGKLRESWDSHKESLVISEELGDTTGISHSLNNLGSIEVRRGLWKNARFSLEESIKLKNMVGDESSLPASLDNLGIVERHEGNLDKSYSLHTEALSIERELGRDHEVAKTLNNLGYTLVEQGQLELAEEKFRNALTIFKEFGDDHGIAQSIGNLGLVSEKRGNTEEAISRFEDTFEKFKELNVIDEAIDTAKNIALLYHNQNDAKNVKKWCDRGERLATNLGQPERASMFRKIRTGDF